MALVNHSCDPNLIIVFWGRTAIAVASRSIAKGEEINDNYGANYANMPLAERRKQMERSHWFTCACR
jgi:SET domain-containing protein